MLKAVGIVTSSTGAALQDILHILARRDPSLKVVIYPTAVQGKEATAEIVQMIELANARQEVDVLIVGRGGGSLEDLWCFNEEEVHVRFSVLIYRLSVQSVMKRMLPLQIL